MTHATLLKIVGLLLLIISVVVALKKFDYHCEKKFNYRFFFNLPMLLTYGAVILSFFAYNETSMKAYHMRQVSEKASHGKVLKDKKAVASLPERKIGNYTADEYDMISKVCGYLAMLLLLGIGAYNVKRTNWKYGLAGTAVQTPLLLAASVASVFVLMIAVALMAVYFATPKYYLVRN